MVQQTLQLSSRTVYGLRDRPRVIRDCNRLVILHARFHHAAFVMEPALGAVLIAEMHFDAGDMIRQMVEGAFHRRFGMFGQLFATFDVIVCVNLDSFKIGMSLRLPLSLAFVRTE